MSDTCPGRSILTIEPTTDGFAWTVRCYLHGHIGARRYYSHSWAYKAAAEHYVREHQPATITTVEVRA